MREVGNHRRFCDFKGNLLTDSKDSVCSRTDTQITGINNSGEISGFYTDASGVAHSFVGCPVGTVCPGFGTSVPEPGALSLFSVGLATLGLCYPCGRKRSPA